MIYSFDAHFFRNKAGAEEMIIDSSGSAGIGTLTPTAKLEVSGNISVIGTGNTSMPPARSPHNIVAKHQMAERVPASEQIPAGNARRARRHQIQSRYLFNQRLRHARRRSRLRTVARSTVMRANHRNRWKEFASKPTFPGFIQVGDLLVTSDKAGMAMKSQPLSLSGVQIHRPGTLIGKALGFASKGMGRDTGAASLQKNSDRFLQKAGGKCIALESTLEPQLCGERL